MLHFMDDADVNINYSDEESIENLWHKQSNVIDAEIHG